MNSGSLSRWFSTLLFYLELRGAANLIVQIAWGSRGWEQTGFLSETLRRCKISGLPKTGVERFLAVV